MNNNITVQGSKIIYTVFVILLVLYSCSSNKTNEQNSDTNLSEIVALPNDLTQADSIDFKPLIQMLGDAQYIGLSEASHYFHEPLDFRNTFIKYLVENKLIDVIGIEAAILESRELYDYVNGGAGNIDSALHYGLSYGFDRLPQNREIVQWLRNYNLDSSNNHKVRLYGFDISGAQGISNREISYSIVEALKFLKGVNEDAWGYFQNSFEPFLDILHFGPFKYYDGENAPYYKLEENERNKLTWSINELINHYKLYEDIYSEKTSYDDYQWAYLAASSSRHIDNWLRTDNNEFIRLSKRDRAAADNVKWIIEKENEPRMLLFANFAHLIKSKVKFPISDTVSNAKVLGNYLSHRYGEKYKVIGHLHQFALGGEYAIPYTSDSIDGVEKHLVNEYFNNYYRDLKSADDEITNLLNKEWQLGSNQYPRFINPYKSMDILFFTKNQNLVKVE